MKTIILSENDLSLAYNIIKNGGLVVSPTETVYGLCANALDPCAVEKIFLAKGRPADNPLIVHISSIDMLDKLVVNIPIVASKLIDAFWPGPLTLIFNASNLVPNIVRADLPTVAIRFPANPIMQKLISNTNLPLAAPSANLSSKPSPTNSKRVIEDLYGKVDAIIDGGECNVGIESTVIDLANLSILRPGSITKSMLNSVAADFDYAIPNSNVPISPGMKYKHYAPAANITIVKGVEQKVIDTIIKLAQKDALNDIKVGVLVTDELLPYFQNMHYLGLGSINNLEVVASNLFEKLRLLDDLELQQVYTIYLPNFGIGAAIMNRLIKASNHQIIEV
ncbi:MAG: threonylcarbamoyl-AMP synthase [Epulopiscium sp. Nuni2H_MBin003]|nr:MAG: threonylcarbamoyl-AMP synthase [Epulopiscium sp. Nuni2H_MBin003]